MSEDIEALIAELTSANTWSSSILSCEELGWLTAELRSGDVRRVASAISRARQVIDDYHANRDNDHTL